MRWYDALVSFAYGTVALILISAGTLFLFQLKKILKEEAGQMNREKYHK